MVCMWCPGHSLAEEEGSASGRWQKRSHTIGTNQNTGGAFNRNQLCMDEWDQEVVNLGNFANVP